MNGMSRGPGGIVARCHAEGGLTEATLGELREELGYKKLGRYVLDDIREHLDKAKLGYFPGWVIDPARNVEPRQVQTVWIYEKSGDLRSQVIDAVLNPDKHDVRAILDGLVGGNVEAMTPEQKLERIRELVDG
jgi:hypothetical protein